RDVILKQRERSPGEQAGGHDFHRTANEKRNGLVLKPNDHGNRQRDRRGRRAQEGWTTKVEDELHTAITSNGLLGLWTRISFMDPQTLDCVLEDRVGLVFVIFHSSPFIEIPLGGT